MYKRQIRFICVCFTLFILLSILLLFKKDLAMDTFVYNLIKPWISPTMTSFFKWVTWFGSAFGILFFTILFLIILKDKKCKVLILINLIGSLLLNQGLKFLFMRHRPFDIALIKEVGYSFPSGHASMSLAFYGFLIYLVWTRFTNKTNRYFLIFILSCIIILIGVSRIYLGVHYFSDVLGGYLITLSYLLSFIIIVDKKKLLSNLTIKNNML